ncbi:hypothetical protein [Solimonas soli]|uniref:hypothetical protein n=1 Tax=Solimonas soli TaxID=413479 RepID=UPI0004B8EBE6|nr:hypothetical protein [Solimonas soli]
MLNSAALAMCLSILAALGGCGDRQRARLPDRASFTAAVSDYLAQRGHLCLAKYDWPITVTPADRQARSLDAQQMPVLEALGLVAGHDAGASEPADGAANARVYTLTREGLKYYLHVPVVIVTATRHVTHAADLCAATLSLDRVVGWEKPLTLDGRTVTSVLFTYRIAPAPWTQAPDARRVFPLLARAIENAGIRPLRLGVHLTPRGWVADELSD